MSTKMIKWKEIKIGNRFTDGSVVTEIHESYTEDVYRLCYLDCNNVISINRKKQSMDLSGTHLLLVDTTKLGSRTRMWIQENFKDWKIPTIYDQHIYCDNIDEFLDKNVKTFMTKDELALFFSRLSQFQDGVSKVGYVATECDDSHIGEQYWLPVVLIQHLVHVAKERVYVNGHRIVEVLYRGEKEVFCVGTDSHKYEANGLIHHNSVSLRNIILHCLTHGEDIAIALVDMKQVEFEFYKGIKNVVGVANTVQECAEILRMQREVMYKRNKEMAKIGINDIRDFRPNKPTDEWMVTNWKFKGTDKITIRLGDEEKEIEVQELENYLQ